MIQTWRKIDPDKELGAAAYQHACRYMSDEDYQKIKAECLAIKRQKELFERKRRNRLYKTVLKLLKKRRRIR
jgi:hypothetical protein